MKRELLSTRARSGFTFIETLIVVALFALMMSTLSLLYISFSTSTVSQKSLAESTARATRAAISIHADVSQAYTLVPSYAFSGTTYFSGPTTLILALPGIGASGGALSDVSDHVLYYLSGTDLHRLIEVGAGSSRAAGSKLLDNAVASLSFTYDSTDFTTVTQVTTNIVNAPGGHTDVHSEITDISHLINHI
jgi:prepilin-type N-terminal cleavage/methylation domain-containing protein